MDHRARIAVRFATTFTLLALTACGGGGGGGGGGSSKMDVEEISHGFGRLVPHQIFKVDQNGNPTQQIVPILTQNDLLKNVTPTNSVLPTATWPETAVLPNGEDGNHFLYVKFSQPLDVDSVLDSDPSGQANSGLLGSINVISLDPQGGNAITVSGRAFVGGRTYTGPVGGSPPQLSLEKWVGLDATGKPEALVVGGGVPGLGFPGTESLVGFPGASQLVDDSTFVFVVDSDGDLRTHETFPTNRQIRVKATTAVRSSGGASLVRQASISTTVGPDDIPPEVASTPPPTILPGVTPGNGQQDVDPSTSIRVEFTEPLQPLSVGPFPTDSAPQISPAISVSFGPPSQQVTVPFSVVPPSVLDLSTYELTMAFAFPGAGPPLFQCGTFNKVQVNINPLQVLDFAANPNTLGLGTFFFTGEGPGLVNAPVTPDAIYVGRLGADPGISVIDLNGFGGSTGKPTFDFTYQSFPEGNSNFPNNPNVRLQGTQIRPQLQPGTCTVDGGSAGAFTLTKDSSLNDVLIKSPLISTVGDMMLGQPLEIVFNNGQEATGCQSGGGNLCAINGKKVLTLVQNTTDTTRPPNFNETPQSTIAGAPNSASWAPHPNPPPLVFPPLCVSPFIASQEVTSIETILPLPPVGPPVGLGLTNLLVPGDALGDPLNGLPPSGLLSSGQNNFMVGPGRAGQPLNLCQDYMLRQQIGHFLYVIDRARREIVVLNSNRFNVITRVPMVDPTLLAMGPNLDFLAVTNRNADSVSFLDVDPNSSTFHQVVKQTLVGRGPRGIAWDPRNEDILVCNEQDNSVSIISAFDLNVRKTVSSQLSLPFDVAITPRQNLFGFFRNVYFAFILNRNGRIALFESGPNGANGWGYDDIVGVTPFVFQNPKIIQPDPTNLNGGCWIIHENPLNPDGTPSNIPGGAVSNLVIDSTFTGQLSLSATQSGSNPQLRDMSFAVNVSIGPDQLTGIPVDMAFDNMTNLAIFPNVTTPYSAGTGITVNGKSAVKTLPQTGVFVPGNSPSYMFLAIPNSSEGPGVIDVISTEEGFVRFDTNAYHNGTQSIPVFGVNFLCDYFRQ